MNSAMTSEDNAQFIIQTIKSKIHHESTDHCRLYFRATDRLHINAHVFEYISVNTTIPTTTTTKTPTTKTTTTKATTTKATTTITYGHNNIHS